MTKKTKKSSEILVDETYIFEEKLEKLMLTEYEIF